MPNVTYGNGIAGTLWSSDDAPQPTVGADGDHCRDRLTGDIYFKSAGSWSLVAFGGGGGGGGGMVPTYIAPGETFTVPANKQALFAIGIDNEGILEVDGVLIEVD